MKVLWFSSEMATAAKVHIIGLYPIRGLIIGFYPISGLILGLYPISGLKGFTPISV